MPRTNETTPSPLWDALTNLETHTHNNAGLLQLLRGFLFHLASGDEILSEHEADEIAFVLQHYRDEGRAIHAKMLAAYTQSETAKH